MGVQSENDYSRGSRMAWRTMLQHCLLNLGQEDREANSWRLEREDVITQLRDLCAKFGDNDWADDLHLGDVIEKHLGRHLYANQDDSGEGWV